MAENQLLQEIEGLKAQIQANPAAADRLGSKLRDMISVARTDLGRLQRPGGNAAHCFGHINCAGHCIAHPQDGLGTLTSTPQAGGGA